MLNTLMNRAIGNHLLIRIIPEQLMRGQIYFGREM